MRRSNIANTASTLLRPKRNLDRQKYLRVSEINPYQWRSLVPREFAASREFQFSPESARQTNPFPFESTRTRRREPGHHLCGINLRAAGTRLRDRDAERTNERADRARGKEAVQGKNEIAAAQRSNFPYSWTEHTGGSEGVAGKSTTAGHRNRGGGLVRKYFPKP